jgi:hypothetical protein
MPYCVCSQQIQFGVQTPQEIVKCGAFHVYERNLYKAGHQRAICSFMQLKKT